MVIFPALVHRRVTHGDRTRPYLEHVDMLKSWLICCLLIVGVHQNGHADDQSKLRAELSGGPPFFKVRLSKFKMRFFVVPPGPCTCSAGTRANLICSVDLQKDLADQIAGQKRDENFQCNPRAGCAVGTETIYAECGQKRRPGKSGP